MTPDPLIDAQSQRYLKASSLFGRFDGATRVKPCRRYRREIRKHRLMVAKRDARTQRAEHRLV